ncbi:MAG TPA: hypothetical protein DC084_10520, partial [Cupriavidus sp.]|nr:hypothetical protein [Cupriavidus sp.]
MLLARDGQGLGDIAGRQGRPRSSQYAKDFFPAGDRIVVLIQFFSKLFDKRFTVAIMAASVVSTPAQVAELV